MVSWQSVPAAKSPSPTSKQRVKKVRSPNSVRLKSMGKKPKPAASGEQESNPLIDSWTDHYMVASPSPIKKYRPVRTVKSPGGIGFSSEGAVSHATFGMSNSGYTFCKRRDPALNTKVLQMIAARRPQTSGSSRGASGREEWGSPTGRPGTAGTWGGKAKKTGITKEQQAEAIKRLAEHHIEKFVPKEKSIFDLKRGKQIIYSRFDVKKMNAVRERQKQYTRQLDESAGDKISLQIDSVTRAVVQQFRKLINSERCALFLHDSMTNELYFKPVGGLDTNVPEIRFPATAGIAGWVATKGRMLNIPNAYKDKRFNPAIDKETGFRTRSILCMPVTEADGTLLGVCQMVNKFEQMKTASSVAIVEGEKEKRYKPFTKEDEMILKKCCERVAEALSKLRFLQKQAVEDEKLRRKEEAERNRALMEGGGGSAGNSEVNTPIGTATPMRSGSLTPVAARSAMNTPKAGSRPIIRSSANTPKVGSRQMQVGMASAKAEVKNLYTFMQGEMGKLEEKEMAEQRRASQYGESVSETASKFQFREVHGPQITSKGQTFDAKEKRDAANKYKRQKAYTTQIQDGVNKGDTLEAAMNSSLRNLMAKFKSMLDCERCGLFFLDEETDELYFHVEEEGENIRFPKTAGIAGSVACSGQGLLIPDVYRDQRFNKAVDKLTGFRTRNILCQPIFDAMGNVIGVMQMVNSSKQEGFSEEDSQKLSRYARKMAMGLTAIRDSGKDGTSAHMQQASMAKIEDMNGVIAEIHKEVDEEKKAYFAKRKEESRHEYTANEAASRFQFRDGGGGGRKEELDDEQKEVQRNKKMMEDIFSGKGVNVDELNKEKKEAMKEAKKDKGRRGSVTGGVGGGGTLDLQALEAHLAAVAQGSLGGGAGAGSSGNTRANSRRGSVVGGHAPSRRGSVVGSRISSRRNSLV